MKRDMAGSIIMVLIVVLAATVWMYHATTQAKLCQQAGGIYAKPLNGWAYPGWGYRCLSPPPDETVGP